MTYHSERKQPLAVHVVHFLFVTFLWRHMQFRIRNNGVFLIVQLVFFNENSWDIINGKFSYDVISLRGIFLGCHILGKAMQCIAETYSGKFNGINLSFLKNYKATFCKKKNDNTVHQGNARAQTRILSSIEKLYGKMFKKNFPKT